MRDTKKVILSYEKWLPIKDYPGYEISWWGRVRSWKRYGAYKYPLKNRLKIPKILKPQYLKTGTFRIPLSDKGNSRKYIVSRLILEHFIGPCPKGLEALHGRGGRKCHYLYNLKWGSHKRNMADKKRDGTDNTGSRHGMSKLTEKKVLEIRRMLKKGSKQKIIAKKFKVCESLVSMIKTEKVWKTII